ELDGDLLCELWRFVLHLEGCPAGALTRRHWRQIASVCRADSAAVDCPAGLRVRRVGRIVRAGPGA
ncbi:MAG: hypothetical protein K1X57_14580, partial [Gemmataceae bacterium]|nr:hypothetical protein [Gemmataceae bacterium]